MPENIIMKKSGLLISFIFICLGSMAQDFSGIWKGKIMTTEKFLPYELAISDSNGILSGYSYTTYTVNSVEMVAVRKIKVRTEGNTLFTDDEDLLYDNFHDKMAKKIKQHNKLIYQLQGNTPTLKGTFETNKTSELRSASGDIELAKVTPTTPTDVSRKLAEMNLLQEMSFTPLDPALKAKQVIKSNRIPYTKLQNVLPVMKSKPVVRFVYKDLPIRKIVAPVVVARTENPTIAKETPAPAIIEEPVPEKPKAPKVESTVAKAPSAAKALEGRTVENIETIYFHSDSLLLTLYDNGEVDGDTVSVIMNGKMILSKQGLSTKAIHKTVYVPNGTGDEIQIVMYAETLGSIPPNTGLLIIQDGNVRHEVRFSGDLKKNAGITLRRKTD